MEGMGILIAVMGGALFVACAVVFVVCDIRMPGDLVKFKKDHEDREE